MSGAEEENGEVGFHPSQSVLSSLGSRDKDSPEWMKQDYCKGGCCHLLVDEEGEGGRDFDSFFMSDFSHTPEGYSEGGKRRWGFQLVSVLPSVLVV